MTLHCTIHCPKDCHKHRNFPHYHPDHCNHACHTHSQVEEKERDLLEEEVGVEENDQFYPLQDFDEMSIFHYNISCNSCGNEVIGPVYHNEPDIDHCQACIQKGISGAEFCIRYTECCGYYGKDGVFSTYKNYHGS